MKNSLSLLLSLILAIGCSSDDNSTGAPEIPQFQGPASPTPSTPGSPSPHPQTKTSSNKDKQPVQPFLNTKNKSQSSNVDAIIKDSKLYSAITIPNNWMKSNRAFHLSSIYAFHEKEVRVNSRLFEQIEDQSPARFNKNLYQFQSQSNQDQTVTIWLSSKDPSTPSLKFLKNGRRLLLVGAKYAKEPVVRPVSILNFSKQNQSGAFNLLFRISLGKDQKSIISMTFIQASDDRKTAGKSGENFNYLYAGEKVRWRKTIIPLNICTSNASYIQIAKRAIQQWNKALPGGAMIAPTVMREFPPFGDINSNCIYFIEDYSLSLRSKHEFAYALMDPNFSKSEFFNGDILLFLEDIKNGSPGTLQKTLERMLIHEIGHFLGLGHNFNSKQSSIMSYNMKQSLISDTDRQALESLY